MDALRHVCYNGKLPTNCQDACKSLFFGECQLGSPENARPHQGNGRRLRKLKLEFVTRFERLLKDLKAEADAAPNAHSYAEGEDDEHG